MAEPVTLESHGELMQRALDGLRDIKDQMQVHGLILVRLESRIPLSNDAEPSP
jgi:hypothetical protein